MTVLRPPDHGDNLLATIPFDHVLQITLNRPNQLNAMSAPMERDLTRVLAWFDDNPDLWCLIITGAGRAFCAGADLKSWQNEKDAGTRNEQESLALSSHGFGAISRRMASSKPIIAAVNGIAYGGGLEMVVNCDIVIASDQAKFGFPEAKVGVSVAQGAIPRIANISGRQLASELLLVGAPISATEARDRFRFVNEVVRASEVIPTAHKWAKRIIACSPDAVAANKKAVLLGMQHAGVEASTVAHAWSMESKRLYSGENIREGLTAFVEVKHRTKTEDKSAE